jgi:plastocyanin
MKWFIGFFVLLIALVAISGCTQTAQTTTPATTVPTTVQTTEPVTVATPVPTTAATTVASTVAQTTATAVTTKIPVTTQTTVASVTQNATATPEKTVTPATGVSTIHITSTGFTPQTDIVLKGMGISWINDDTVSHTIKTIGKHEGVFTSPEIIPHGQFAYDFGNDGTFDYLLDNNPKLNGTIIVKS